MAIVLNVKLALNAVTRRYCISTCSLHYKYM